MTENEVADAIQTCFDNQSELTDWELRFVDELYDTDYEDMTNRQFEKLKEIAVRVEQS